MPKLSEQIKKANISNIIKKVKNDKVINKTEIAAIEEFENLQEVESGKTGNYLLVGSKEAAQFFGISERSFFRWVEAGMPKETKGVYNLKKCFDWWKENINNVSTEKEKEVRLKYWKAKAEGENIRTEVRKGELISKDEVYNEFNLRLVDIKTSLLSMKNRLSADCEWKSRDEIRDIMEEDTRAMFSAFSSTNTLLYTGKTKNKTKNKKDKSENNKDKKGKE